MEASQVVRSVGTGQHPGVPVHGLEPPASTVVVELLGRSMSLQRQLHQELGTTRAGPPRRSSVEGLCQIICLGHEVSWTSGRHARKCITDRRRCYTPGGQLPTPEELPPGEGLVPGDRSEAVTGWSWGYDLAMATTGRPGCSEAGSPGSEPSKAALPKAKMPPSRATSR